MLGDLKDNENIYVLDRRRRPVLLPAEVVEVKPPTTQFGQPAMPGNNFLPTFTEITVRVNGNTMTFAQVPCGKNLYDTGNGWVLTNDRDALCAYIDNMKQTSLARIANIPVDEEIVEACDEIMPQLNPSIRKEQERDRVVEERFTRIEGLLERIIKELPSKE